MRVALVALLMTVGSAEADTHADKLFAEGRRYLAKHDYERACKAFEASFEAEAAIGTQLNIALCHQQAGHLVKTYRAYAKARQMATTGGDKRVAEIGKLVEQAQNQIARVAVTLPPGATLVVDDMEVEPAMLDRELVVDPGTHVLVVHVPKQPPRRETLQLTAGERRELRVEPPPEAVEPVAKPPSAPVASTPRPHRKTGRLIGGGIALTAGVAAVAAGGYIVFDARSTYNGVVAMCPDRVCTTPEAFQTTSDARARARAMTYVVAGGVAVIGVGVYLLATSRQRDDRHLVASPVVGNHAIGLSIGGAL